MRHVLKETNPDFEIQSASDEASFQQCTSNANFDLLVLDYLALDTFGSVEIQLLKKQYPKMAILILSQDNDEERIIEFISAGVDGYITKVCSLQEIQFALEALLSHRKYYCSRIMDILVRASGHSNQEQDPASLLSSREIKIIERIAKGQSTSEIASELCLSVHTINSHRKNILRKTNVKNQAALVYKALTEGIISVQ